jgi:hypothetical protein
MTNTPEQLSISTREVDYRTRRASNRLAITVLGCILVLPGCFPAPLRVANPVKVTVVDAETGRPIGNAAVVHIVCTGSRCENATLLRTTTGTDGALTIDGRRQWGVWIAAPHGMPFVRQFTAIWADGYSGFVHSDFHDTAELMKLRARRQDLIQALASIPNDLSSSDPSLNPVKNLRRATIQLKKVTP